MNSVRITQNINYGNLTGLIGAWSGANGFNMIAVPNQAGGFTLLVAPYTENLTINAVSATTPNRGLNTIANLPTLEYSTKIVDSRDQSLMHVENGFWELVDASANIGFDIFRLANIPHGNSLVAMGVSSVTQGPPNINPNLSGVPLGDLPTLNGYLDPFGFPLEFPDFDPSAPNQTLINYLNKQIQGGFKVTQTVELKISTQNRGGITDIASLRTNANATQFEATFWLETLEDPSGNITHQLQYSQVIFIQFPISSNLSGQTIVWPHINVNTLTLNSAS